MRIKRAQKHGRKPKRKEKKKTYWDNVIFIHNILLLLTCCSFNRNFQAAYRNSCDMNISFSNEHNNNNSLWKRHIFVIQSFISLLQSCEILFPSSVVVAVVGVVVVVSFPFFCNFFFTFITHTKKTFFFLLIHSSKRKWHKHTQSQKTTITTEFVTLRAACKIENEYNILFVCVCVCFKCNFVALALSHSIVENNDNINHMRKKMM